jgi:hypothetical protein
MKREGIPIWLLQGKDMKSRTRALEGHFGRYLVKRRGEIKLAESFTLTFLQRSLTLTSLCP